MTLTQHATIAAPELYCITALPISHFIPRARLLLTMMHCSLCKISSFALGIQVCSLDDPWSFAASQTRMHFINRCTWKSSQHYIIISMMTSFMRMSQKLVFHQSKCIFAIKRILSTTAMYVSSSSFMYLRFPCCCDACLNSSDLPVGLKTLLNTILGTAFTPCFLRKVL